MMQVVSNLEPLLHEVREQLQVAKQEQADSKQILGEKISLFGNQMVKLRSDFTTVSTENRKILDSFGRKLKTNDEINKEMSQLIAKSFESIALLYSLSIDRTFIIQEPEIYVTYNDGILLDMSEFGDTIKYRRKTMHPEIAKRAVLTELGRLIDHVVLKQPNIGWTTPDMKPSHFFSSIHSAYITLFEDH